MEQQQFTVGLTPESQSLLLNSVNKLLDTAIEEAVERASIQKHFVAQLELKKMFNIGADTLSELEKRGLRRIPLGKKVLYDLEEVAEIFNEMKI